MKLMSNELTINERTTHLVEYWKQTTLVQQHFNDISMKVRNFAIVIFSGFLTGVALSIHKGIFVDFFGLKLSAGIIFSVAGAFVTQLIHFMDTYWYHVFLKGAVGTSMKVEKEINEILGISQLADGITSQSQNVSILSLFGLIHLPIGTQSSSTTDKNKYRFFLFKEIKVDSTLRHKIFYRWLVVIILSTGFASLFITIPEAKNIKDNSIQPQTSITRGEKTLLALPKDVELLKVAEKAEKAEKAEIIK